MSLVINIRVEYFIYYIFPDNATIFLMVIGLGISIFPKLKRIYVLRINICSLYFFNYVKNV